MNINYQYLNLNGSKNGVELIFVENAENPVLCSNGEGYVLRYDNLGDTTVKSSHISSNVNTYLYLKEEKNSVDTLTGLFFDGANNIIAPAVVFTYPLSSSWRNPCSDYYDEEFLIAWQDNFHNDALDIYVQFVNKQGGLIDNMFRINSGVAGNQSNAAVCANESGYLIAWESDIQGQNGKNIVVSYVKRGLGTDPFVADTDDDGVSDSVEIAEYSSDPKNADTDNDGLSDGQEVNSYNTIPTVADTDNDGVDDGVEVNELGIDPLNPDSDSDGMSDGGEVLAGMDPADPLSVFSMIEVSYNPVEAGVKISWTVTDQPNRSYRIFWKNFSDNPVWTEIIEPDFIDNSNGTKSYIDTGSLFSTQRVYKVTVEFAGN